MAEKMSREQFDELIAIARAIPWPDNLRAEYRGHRWEWVGMRYGDCLLRRAIPPKKPGGRKYDYARAPLDQCMVLL